MTKFIRTISLLLLFLFAAGTGGLLHAMKIYNSNCGMVYLCSGDSIVADGDLNVVIPKKKEKLKIIEHPYSAENKILQQQEPSTIDSLVVWSRTAPGRRHTFVYINNTGWCHLAEQGSESSVLCYGSKGYSCSGNGGLWFRGKGEMLLLKDGVVHRFGKPDKKVNAKMRRRLEVLFSDNTAVQEYIRSARGRCDKVLRAIPHIK